MKNQKLTIIADLWKDYQTKVLPRNCSDIQLIETRKAFYAGAGALLNAIYNILEGGEEVTEQDLDVMDAIHNELQRFVMEMKKDQN